PTRHHRLSQKEDCLSRAANDSVRTQSLPPSSEDAECVHGISYFSFNGRISAKELIRPGYSGRSDMKLITVTIPGKDATIGSRIGLAATSLSRLFGLLGKRDIEPGSGILIRPSSGVHTFFMMSSIDVVGLDRNLKVIKVWKRLKPFRVTSVSLKIQ